MSMSRKHFKAIAEVIHKADYLNGKQKLLLAVDLCGIFTNDNPRFRPIEFIDACNPEEDK